MKTIARLSEKNRDNRLLQRVTIIPDKLITKVSVTTKRLLGSDIEKDKVRLILSIVVKSTNDYKIFKHY